MNQSDHLAASPQTQIEQRMRLGMEEYRWQVMVLFSSDGLIMAHCGDNNDSEDRLLELAYSFAETIRLLKESPVKEITVRSHIGRLLVFRCFRALDDNLILAAIHAGRKGYRRAMNTLIRFIQSL